MSAAAENFEKLLARLRASCGGGRADVCVRAAVSAALLLASSLFMLYCASRIDAECAISGTAAVSHAGGSEAADNAKKLALDRVLYEDFFKAAGDSKSGGSAEFVSPVSVMDVLEGAQGGRRIPSYVPTVTLKALAVLGGESVCVLDIDGEKPGTVFRECGSFGGGKGRIVKIDADGVTWRWADKEYAAGL